MPSTIAKSDIHRVALLADNGCDRATAYHMSNKVLRHRDGLFVTWLDERYRIILAQVEPGSGDVLTAFPLENLLAAYEVATGKNLH
jgi:hypothetical protein